MAVHITYKEQCCGCTACASICGHQAITMVSDAAGFDYPVVDGLKCIECGLCEQVCQFKTYYERYDNYEEPLYYALRCNNAKELRESQSGGAFYLISEEILRQDGVVYGAVYGEHFRIEHLKAVNQVDRNRMRGSKYVQSYLDCIFRQVRNDLKNNKKVLFSGTPCQIAGLRSFISKHLAGNLITIDLLCHGVASPKFWSEYIKMIEKRIGKPLTAVNMRDKSYGWLSSDETYQSGKIAIHKNTFYSLYYGELISRPSCFNCPYTNTHRVGDLTIGDYQGWNKHHVKYNDNTGVSLVLVNSEKGNELFKLITKDSRVFCMESTFEECSQLAMVSHAIASMKYADFWNDFQRRGILYVCKKYGDMSLKTQVHIFIAKQISKLKKYLHV